MKRFTQFGVCLLLAGAATGSASAKDLYVSANGNNANDGLTAATAKKTLTALDGIIDFYDTVHISGILSMDDEVPAGFNPGVGYSGSDLDDAGGVYVSHDAGKKIGFNLAARGSRNWMGITFVGEDPEADGFSGDGKWGHFIIRGSEGGGFTFKNLCFVDGISNLDGGTIYIKDQAAVTFENCVPQQPPRLDPLHPRRKRMERRRLVERARRLHPHRKQLHPQCQQLPFRE